MRRVFLSVLTGALLMAMGGTAMAHPGVSLDPTLPADVTYSATDNVEYLGRFPEHAGTAGGMRLGDVYYVTDPRGVFTYDVAGDKAEAPELLGYVPLYQTGTGAALAQEDPNTNGEILVVDGATTPYGSAQLSVIDVSDPTDLSVLSTLPVTDHTWTCVTEGTNGCAYAYGRTGHIIDLRDPANPVKLPHTWRTVVGYGTATNSPYAHDLTEIRPGLVMSAGSSNILMDTTDPAVPVELNRISGTHAFRGLGYHSVEWALEDGNGLSDLFVAGTEISPNLGGVGVLSGASAGTDCQGEESVIETFDASAVVDAIERYDAGEATAAEVRAAQFVLVDTFDVSGRGIYLDGNAPGNVLYCAHWMEFSPNSDSAGGQIAVSYYDRGTRFLSVDADGTMSEDGWIVPLQGYSGSVQWVTDDILYIHDYTRGLEVVRLDGEATGTYRSATSAQLLTSSFTPASPLHTDGVAPAAMLLLGFGLMVAETTRRRTVRD